MSESYKNAGVDVNAGYESVEKIKPLVQKTFIPGVLSGLGGFGGLFAPDLSEYSEPVLVSGTDGVGTKLKLAFLLDKHDTIGIDAVAMCVNDVVCGGAKPLFFLDYVALGKNYPEKVAQIIKGISDGCVQAGCALIGGETAEMPGFYPIHEYDIAGFCVGIVDKTKIIDSTKVSKGNMLIGLPSSGVHSNGFSLIRKVFGITDSAADKSFPELNATLYETLLCPTKIYVKPILSLIEQIEVLGIAHITGGGFYENIPRMLPKGLGAKINKSAIPQQPIFKLIQTLGIVPEHDMYNTFNMGIGMVIAVDAQNVDKALESLRKLGENPVVLGEVVQGEGVIL